MHTQTKTNQSQHSTDSHWVESTSGRAHRKTNRALGSSNTILTILLWLSLPRFSHSFNVMCVTDDSCGEIRKPAMWFRITEVLNSKLLDCRKTLQLLRLPSLLVWVIKFKLGEKTYVIVNNIPAESFLYLCS